MQAISTLFSIKTQENSPQGFLPLGNFEALQVAVLLSTLNPAWLTIDSISCTPRLPPKSWRLQHGAFDLIEGVILESSIQLGRSLERRSML